MVFFSTCMFPQIWSVNLWSNALQSQCLSVVSVSALVMWSHCHLSVPKVGEKLCHVSSDWKKRRKKKEISMTREGKVAKRKNTKAKEERKELSTQTKQGKIREQMEGRGEGLTSNYQKMKENRRSEVAVSINRGEGIRGQKVRRANCETHTKHTQKTSNDTVKYLERTDWVCLMLCISPHEAFWLSDTRVWVQRRRAIMWLWMQYYLTACV